MAQTPMILAAADAKLSAANTDISITYAASVNRHYHQVHAIYAAYSDTLIGDYSGLVREVQVLEGSNIVFRKTIAGVECDLVFAEPISTGAGKALTVKLTAGGEGIVGSLSVLHDTKRS